MATRKINAWTAIKNKQPGVVGGVQNIETNVGVLNVLYEDASGNLAGNPAFQFSPVGGDVLVANNLTAFGDLFVGDKVTATTFNNVAITNAGSATNFLNEQGTYIVPPSLPAGADTEVQFNDGGVLAGDSNFSFNKGSGDVSVGGNLSANTINNVALTAAGTEDHFLTEAGTYVPGTVASDRIILTTGSQAIQIPPIVGSPIGISYNASGLPIVTPDITLSALGIFITILTVGDYKFKVRLNINRTGAGVAPILVFQTVDSDENAVNTFATFAEHTLETSDAQRTFEYNFFREYPVVLPNNPTFQLAFMTDPSGSNFGGLLPGNATISTPVDSAWLEVVKVDVS